PARAGSLLSGWTHPGTLRFRDVSECRQVAFARGGAGTPLAPATGDLRVDRGDAFPHAGRVPVARSDRERGGLQFRLVDAGADPGVEFRPYGRELVGDPPPHPVAVGDSPTDPHQPSGGRN